MSRSAALPETRSPRTASPRRAKGTNKTRAALLLAGLATLAQPLRAADPTATERLMGMAACIQDAGDMKGAPREAFMKDCMARKARATPTASAAEPVLPGQAVAPVATPKSDALPAQERILACAAASKAMQGEARADYLKHCLRQEQAVPAGATQAMASAPRDDGAARQRAACVVGARDLQGAARKAFITRCIAAHAPPRQAAVAPAPVNAQPRLIAQDRLTRSKACADEARSQALVGEQVMPFMSACMARP